MLTRTRRANPPASSSTAGRIWDAARWRNGEIDSRPKFAQLIKLVQQETGRGSEGVGPPRLTLAGAERKTALATIAEALASKPRV